MACHNESSTPEPSSHTHAIKQASKTLEDRHFSLVWKSSIESANSDIAFSPSGAEVIQSWIVKLLKNRLYIEEWYRTHPETANTPVDEITLVVGLPRTGTTALVGMMATDPSFRVLRQWEASAPCPPPDIKSELSDPRVAEARAFAHTLPVELALMHHLDPLGPEEDFDLTRLLAAVSLSGMVVAIGYDADF